MAEQTRRPRRADRYTQAPQRVSDAAAHPASTGENAVPSAALQEQSGAAQVSRYPSQGIPQMAPQTGFPPQGAAPYPPQRMPAYAQPAQQPYPPQYAQQQYQQQAMQQEMALQEAWQREQQRQMQLQEQQRQEQQRQERERVSSQTSSHGAFRGYTGEIPVGPGNRGAEPPAQPKPGKRLGLILVLAALAVVLITGGVVGLQSYQRARQIHEAVAAYDNFFAEGVYVDGIHLGGMTPEQGQNSVQSQIQRRNDAWLVTLSYQGTQMAQINAGMLGMSVDIGQVLNDAWAQARYGTDEERYAQMQALREHPYEAYTATPSGDTSVIDHVLLQVKSQIDRQAVNARLLAFDPTQAYPFSFQEESSGLRLNTEELRTELYHMVSTMSSGTLELQPETVEPEVHILDLQKHYMLRSSVYTPISTSSEENRNNNIRRAFEFINGYVLQPGDQFSFNSVVGQRTEENGFFPAIEYAYGEHVMGIGGGVCQASTTLYQAAVCAGLQIVKRQPHSDAVSYTEYGKDATVYWVGKRKIDLVFRNSSEDPIYMVASVLQDPSNKRRLIAKVMMYGADMGDVRYEIETKTVQEIDPPENPVYVKDKEGTYVTYTDQQKSVSKAKPGYVVESYRVKYAGNTETERTILYTDTYDPKPERIYVGVNRRGD